MAKKRTSKENQVKYFCSQIDNLEGVEVSVYTELFGKPSVPGNIKRAIQQGAKACEKYQREMAKMIKKMPRPAPTIKITAPEYSPLPKKPRGKGGRFIKTT